MTEETAKTMVDCHIHMVLDGVYWKDAIARHKDAPQETLIRSGLSHYRSLGCTYLRDGGDRWGVCTLSSQIAPEYGIRYRTPAFPICKAGHYGTFIGRSFDTPDEYRALLREAKEQGAHFIKLMISGIMDFDHFGVITGEPLPTEEIRAIIDCAHDAGFAVMAHANGEHAVSAALDASVDSVEHGAYLSDETLARLGESRAVWVPTLAAVGNIIGCGRYNDEALREILASQLRAVKKAADLGANIACGSDAGAYLVPHGEGGLNEMTYLCQALGQDADRIIQAGNERIAALF